MTTADRVYHWTKEEIIETVTLLAKKRYSLSFDDFVANMQDGKLDPCRDGDLIALLGLIYEDKALVAA